MKKIISSLVFLFLLCCQLYAQKKALPHVIPLDPAHWEFSAGKVEFAQYEKKPVMKIASGSGQVVLKNVVFQSGVIEFDVNPAKTEFAASVYFHRKNQKEQEVVYLRVPKVSNPFANEAIQYCPYLNSVNMWDMYPQYQAPAPAKAGEWNHIKLIISGLQMRVFVNNQRALNIPKLEGRICEGSIAFEGDSYIRNLIVRPGETEGLDANEAADITEHEANYIRSWTVSQPAYLAKGTEPTRQQDIPKNESFVTKMQAERYGLINLTRQFGGSDQRRIVWLKATITTHEPVKTNLQLGFSDEIWLYLNDQITYTDKNIFPQNMKKYPDGRISIRNGSTQLKLKEGENHLLIGIANDFYGWGLMARLESLEGITAVNAFIAPKEN
ncbi:hypothetical protein LZG74_12195 [Dyadobacter sp. CY327]|uniref:hypothetical protein n=1 Tax=Dyadobacter sp. CY327 TaxID=2907301 RepID=UPI001F2BE0FD|nr:hypothetical protein [Dyadobacter sp. CY327]MCE7071070.1 hypothetical protein [Dyadobacter sp. CY327]